MEIRLASKDDLKQIQDLFVDASEYMKSEGNLIQWQEKDFASKENVLQLIAGNDFYVAIDQSEIIGFYKLQYGIDKTYNEIRKGKWLNDKEYVTIHRFAVKNHRKGIATLLLNRIETEILKKGIYNIRIDTHKDNVSMNAFLHKNNFIECGEIACLCDFNDIKQLRVAYQKVLKR